MKIVKNYENFSDDYRLNENLISKAWGALLNFFRGRFGNHAWLYYVLYLKKNNQLPADQVEFYCPSSYLTGVNLPSEKEIQDDLDRLGPDEFEDEEDEEVKEGLDLGDTGGFVSMRHIDPNMRNVNVKQLMERIERVYKMNLLRAGRHQEEKYDTKSKFVRKKTHAIFIWGAPGIGKTEILHQVAKKLEIAVLEWHLATIEPTDFRGVPKVVDVIGKGRPEDERTVTRLPAIFPTSDGKNGKGGIMFFDELNRAPDMVLSASLSLALSGKHGEYELPPRWIVIAAGNRPDDITGRLQDDPILWNRFLHVNYVPDIEEWVDYVKNIPHVNPDLVAFLTAFPTYYHQLAPESAAPNWPSPRTWEMASEEEYFERGEDWKNRISSREMMEIYEDLVGYQAAKKYVAFVEELEEKRREEERKKRGNMRSKGSSNMKDDLDDFEGMPISPKNKK